MIEGSCFDAFRSFESWRNADSRLHQSQLSAEKEDIVRHIFMEFLQ